MKRSRMEDAQFSGRVINVGNIPATTASQQIPAGNNIPTVQPQPGIASMGSAPPTIQYTTYYPHSGKPGNSNAQPQAQPVSSVPHAVSNTQFIGSGSNIARGANNVQGNIPVTSLPANQRSGTSAAALSISTQQIITPHQPIPNNAFNYSGQEKIQRLKVEDALSYLDQVKYKFGNQPQVYNDFLDIMKEFKSQSIDTPGVIQRVSNLFKGHPELIVGFNTFLPPGYKIEVQANDQGVAFQVSVSVPSPSGSNTTQVNKQSSPNRGIIHSIPQSVPSSDNNAAFASSYTPAAVSNPNVIIGHSHMNHTFHPGSTESSSVQIPITPAIQPQTYRERIIPSPFPVMSSNPLGQAIPNTEITVQPARANKPADVKPFTQMNTSDDANSQGHTLLHISQAHQSILQAEQTGGPLPNQPVEFNAAISYVNKIKSRFISQPDKYKTFLDILHVYQKDQKNIRDGMGNNTSSLSETEVYKRVALLFHQQEDLLREFKQFLPDAENQAELYNKMVSVASSNVQMDNTKRTAGREQFHRALPVTNKSAPYKSSNGQAANSNTTMSAQFVNPIDLKYDDRNMPEHSVFPTVMDKTGMTKPPSNTSTKYELSGSQQHPVDKRTSNNEGPSNSNYNSDHQPSKRQRPISKDVSLADASKYGSLSDYAFFDKVRKALRNPDVYDNFLRCITLFNQEIISTSELIDLSAPFLSRFPDLNRWFQEFIGSSSKQSQSTNNPVNVEENQMLNRRNDRILDGYASVSTEHNPQEIDLSTCRRLGTSYCALPGNQEAMKCSGRTSLCRDVLNDEWASFPSWSEDSTFVTSRKTHYEEIIHRCEDERFELDVVIEANAATIRVLECVQKLIYRMTPDELGRYRLDDCLGGNSPTIHQRALRRIYGDKAIDVIEGIKKNPAIAVPVALKRLKAKEEEWRDAQKSFNKQWREQTDKYYWKSLDHQGINFKQTDIKALRSKSLLNEIETIYDERHEHSDDKTNTTGPHLVLSYKEKSILDDASNLLIHHVKRLTSIQKLEKSKIKQLLRQLLPDMFFSPRQKMSDDEREDDTDGSTDMFYKNRRSDSRGNQRTAASNSQNNQISNEGGAGRFDRIQRKNDADTLEISKSDVEKDTNNPDVQKSTSSTSDNEMNLADEEYTLFFGNSNWYLFYRLHAILCDRLYNICELARRLLSEELQCRNNRSESTATALKLKPKSNIQIEEYYNIFIDMLKNVLDGNMDSNNFEDSMREMFGIHAYKTFTLDRVVTSAVRQLQHAVTERISIECCNLYKKQRISGQHNETMKSLELAYQRKAESILRDENCFKICIYKHNCRVSIELLDSESEVNEKAASAAQNWNTYDEMNVNLSNSTDKPNRQSAASSKKQANPNTTD